MQKESLQFFKRMLVFKSFSLDDNNTRRNGGYSYKQNMQTFEFSERLESYWLQMRL